MFSVFEILSVLISLLVMYVMNMLQYSQVSKVHGITLVLRPVKDCYYGMLVILFFTQRKWCVCKNDLSCLYAHYSFSCLTCLKNLSYVVNCS